MIHPARLTQRYEQYRPIIVKLAEIARSIWLPYCDENGYAFVSRVKTIDSLAEKIETGRYTSWSDLDDLFGCNIIIPTLNDEEKVIAFAQQIFDTDQIIRRGQSLKAPDVFRFDSTRIRARIKRPELHPSDAPLGIFDPLFEIQIKSAFEHAWAVTTHSLAYKCDEVDWRRMRIAAQIKATVEQLDTLILSFDDTTNHILPSNWKELDFKRNLAIEVQSLFDEGHIPSELSVKDVSRLCDNILSLIKSNRANVDIENAFQVVVNEIKEMPIDSILRSISLWQFIFGILISKEIIKPPFNRYVCHVTPELIAIFPNIEKINVVFNYDR